MKKKSNIKRKKLKIDFVENNLFVKLTGKELGEIKGGFTGVSVNGLLDNGILGDDVLPGDLI